MRMRLHRLDVRYAAMTDAEVEALWRASAPGEREVALVRQVVLRALDVIELTCAEAGRLDGFSDGEIERAGDEAAVRLFARLHTNQRVKNTRALACKLALEVIADTDRRRFPVELRFLERRPRLTLIEGKVER